MASRVKVTVRSVFDLSSAWTSMASLRGVLPAAVPVTHRSGPHSYTIHSPLRLMRARRTLSSVCLVSGFGSPALLTPLTSWATMFAHLAGLPFSVT